MVRIGPRALQACRYALLAAGVALLQACGSPTEPTPPWPPPWPPPPAVLAITCPALASGVSHFNQPVAVAWSAPTTSGGTAPVATTCMPSSGTTFAAGTTTVTCRASDAGTQSAVCSFQVTVVRPPELTATRFMAFGDSLTEGQQVLALPFLVVVPNEAYPFRLNILMSARYEDQTIVVDNEGKSGEWISDGLARLPGVLTARNPQVLLLLDGANDLLNDLGIAVPRIIDRLQRMVRLA
ncbi:MAG: HYR domain-containing protein, partial [Acidobacteriota bacterium]